MNNASIPTPRPTWWSITQRPVADDDIARAIEQASSRLAGLPLSKTRDRKAVGKLARSELSGALRELGYGRVPEALIEQHVNGVASQVGGLRFLDALIPPHWDDYTDIQLNADGSVWARPRVSCE
jgi:hypothetical protein